MDLRNCKKTPCISAAQIAVDIISITSNASDEIKSFRNNISQLPNLESVGNVENLLCKVPC